MAIRTHNSHIKAAIFLFSLLFLPLVVFYASNEKLQDLRSKAFYIEGGGGCSEDQILNDKYNIRVTGVGSCQKRRVILDAIFNAYSYSGLKQRLGNDPLVISNVDEDNKNWAYTVSDKRIRLYQFEENSTDEKWRYIITHELFHLLDLRKPQYVRSYPYDALSRQDEKCFKNTDNKLYLRTYATVPKNQKSESFAESGVLFIFDRSPIDGSIRSFKKDCPASYRWFDENIF